MDLGTVLTKHPDAAYRVYDGKAVVVLPGRAEVNVLNGTGGHIWERIDGKNSLAEILETVVGEYTIGREQAEADLHEFVAALQKQGMVS